MGIGDDVIATGLAKGSFERGELTAFGDGRRIIWGGFSASIFMNNPNIARPGQERDPRVKWYHYYKGHRIYNSAGGDRWNWNYNFRVKPGEFYFHPAETYWPNEKLIIVEPNLPNKRCAPNKQWPLYRWRLLVKALLAQGWDVKQFDYPAAINKIVGGISTPSYRHAAGRIKSARLAILPEGGLHHAAAAVGTPAVVLFGGFVPPDVLGYDGHTNLTGGVKACGRYDRCQHCIDALNNITVENVLSAVEALTK